MLGYHLINIQRSILRFPLEIALCQFVTASRLFDSIPNSVTRRFASRATKKSETRVQNRRHFSHVESTLEISVPIKTLHI